MPTSKKPSKLPIILIIICACSLLVAFRHVTTSFRLPQRPPVQLPPTPFPPTPTPIGLPYKTFIEPDESFGFSFPASWSAQLSKTDKKTTTTTNFTACGKTALILTQIKNPTVTLQEYLNLATEPKESKINGRDSIMISTAAESVTAIADEAKRELIVLSYIPTCGLTMDEGKAKEFLPLLESFTFY